LPQGGTTPAQDAGAVAPAQVAPVGDGRSTRWADHRAARRTELAHVARRAVHHHGPDVSMDEIAAEAGTSKSIVYRYFRDKSGLQAAVGEVVLEQMHARLDQAVSTAVTPRDGLRSMIGAYLEMVEGSPNVYWFVTRPAAEDASVSLGRFLDAIATIIARPFVQLASGRGPAGSAVVGHVADVWAAGAVGFVKGAGDWWLAHRDDPDAPSRDELAERVTTWLWAGPVSSLSRPRPDTATSGAPGTPPLDDEETS
jgi:AcrR family transcriptional regulator